MKTTYAEVWVTLEKPSGGRMMKQFFCASRADAIAKVTEWVDNEKHLFQAVAGDGRILLR